MTSRRLSCLQSRAFLKLVDATGVTGSRKGEVLFSQGETAKEVFYVERGQVRLTVKSKRGKEAVLAILGPGNYVGEGCLTRQSKRIATAITTRPGAIWIIGQKETISVLHERIEVSEHFIGKLVKRNLQIVEALMDQLFHSCEKRLARALLQLAQYGRTTKVKTIAPEFNQSILAAKIGSTRARVCFFMKRFEKLGYVKYRGGLRINNSLLKEVMHY